jgi:hypothetical protein
VQDSGRTVTFMDLAREMNSCPTSLEAPRTQIMRARGFPTYEWNSNKKLGLPAIRSDSKAAPHLE